MTLTALQKSVKKIATFFSPTQIINQAIVPNVKYSLKDRYFSEVSGALKGHHPIMEKNMSPCIPTAPPLFEKVHLKIIITYIKAYP